MRSMPVTQDLTGEEFTFWQYQQARDASKITDDKERQSRFEAMGYSFEDVENAIKASGAEYYIALVDALETTSEVYKSLNNTLRGHCGADAPPSSQINQLLEELVRTTRFLSKDIIDAFNAQQAAAEPSAEETSDQQTSEAGPGVATAAMQIAHAQVPVGAITNREDALKQLALIADYFRTYEPHTPLASTLDRAVQWGRMTLPELILELIPDETAKALYSQLTGVITDGTSTEKYIPPPKVTTQPAQGKQETPSDTSAASAEQPATTPAEPQNKSSADVGW
jgi:type VI secretion system protein ImpA